MKNLTAVFFVLVFSCGVFAQTDKKEIVFLPSKMFKERVVEQNFPDVPKEIRDCYGRGTKQLRKSNQVF